MAEVEKKTKVKTRIQHKHDLEVNWLNAVNFTPLAGELIIYDKEVDGEGNVLALPSDRTQPYAFSRFKFGDGKTTVNALPFISSDPPQEIYVGEGEMPEDATVQIILDAENEEENLMNQLEEYVDSKIEEGLSGVDTKIENSLNELKTEDIKYSVEGSFVHQQGFDGTLHEALNDYSNAIGNNYGYTQEALYNISTLSENMSSMSESFGNALWAEDGLEPRVSELEAFLGYTDDDIIGLSADFENNSFTRLAGATGLEAGEDFNKFPVYRDRVRCNVADDGTITARYGEGISEDEQWMTLTDFTSIEINQGAACPPWVNEEDFTGGTGEEGNFSVYFSTTPHPTDVGKSLKISIENVTTGETYILEDRLSAPSSAVNHMFGSFQDSNGTNCVLTGYPVPTESAEVGALQFFIYPRTTDTIRIKLELNQVLRTTSVCEPTIIDTWSKMGSDEDSDDVGGNHTVSTIISLNDYIGKTIAFKINNFDDGTSTIIKGPLGNPEQRLEYGTFLTKGGETVITLHALWGDYGLVLFTYPICRDKIEIEAYIEESSIFADDGSNGQVMVYQPAFYYKVAPVKLEKQEDGIGFHIRKANYYISSTPKPSFKLHPAFYDKNGKPVRYILYSAYECQSSDSDEQNPPSLSSIAGIAPSDNVVRPQAEAYAQTRGENWHVESVQAMSANQLLMMIEYGNPNIQTVFAKGPVNVPSCNFLITGSTSELGNASGSALSSTDTEGNVYSGNGSVAISYRGMENPWGNIAKHVSNIYSENYANNKNKYKVFIYEGNDQFSEGTLTEHFTGFTIEAGYVSAFGYGYEKYDWLLIPSEGSGNSTNPVGDVVRFNGEPEVILPYSPVIGGWCTTGDEAGLFCADFFGLTGFSASCRIMYLPVNTDNSSMVV